MLLIKILILVLVSVMFLVVGAAGSTSRSARPRSWRALGAKWRAAEQQAYQARSEWFRFDPYCDRWQRFWEPWRAWFYCRSARLARAGLTRYQAWLQIVSAYGPQIVAQARAYERAFMDWERWNRANRDHQCPEAMTRERAAVAEADRLQQEVWTRLAAHNFRFRTDYWDHLIAHQRAMDLGDRAAVSAENVERFWSGMQQFLEGRVARLSKAAGIPS